MKLWILSLYSWYALMQLSCANGDYEHVHIKVHIPRITQKHFHVRTVENHHFHPKKKIKHQEVLPQANSIEPITVLHSHPLDAIAASSGHDYSDWDLDNVPSLGGHKSKFPAFPQTYQWENYYENDEPSESLPDFQSTYSLMKPKLYPKFRSKYNDYGPLAQKPQITNYENDEFLEEEILEKVPVLKEYANDERFEEPISMSTNYRNKWLLPYENIKFNGWQQSKNVPKIPKNNNWSDPKYLSNYESGDLNVDMNYGKSGKFIDYDYKNELYTRLRPKKKTKSRFKSNNHSTGNKITF